RQSLHLGVEMSHFLRGLDKLAIMSLGKVGGQCDQFLMVQPRSFGQSILPIAQSGDAQAADGEKNRRGHSPGCPACGVRRWLGHGSCQFLDWRYMKLYRGELALDGGAEELFLAARLVERSLTALAIGQMLLERLESIGLQQVVQVIEEQG